MHDFSFINSYQNRKVLDRAKYETFINKINFETRKYLFEIGVPSCSYLNFNFADNQDYFDKNTDLLFLGSESICIACSEDNEVRISNKYGKVYLGSSLKNFALTLFEFDLFIETICKYRIFGEINTLLDKEAYISYLKFRLLQIDNDFFKKDKDYYWGAIIEEMQRGIISF